MSQVLLELRQPKPLEILVEISPVKEGPKISSVRKKIIKQNSPEISINDLIGLAWIFLDPLEEEW